MTERRVQTICLLILATVATGAALQALSDVMIPFALAVFFSIALAPVVDFLGDKTRLSRGVSVGLTMLLGALLLAILAGVVANSLDAVEKADWINPLTGQPKLLESEPPKWTGIAPEDWARLTGGVLETFAPRVASLLGGFLSQGITVLIFLMFLLLEQGRSRGRAQLDVESTVGGTVESRVKKYISVKVLTSAVTGTLVGLSLWVLGVPAAVLFGLLTFLLNFIPTIGSVIAVALPLLVLLPGDASYGTIGLAMAIPGAIQFAVGQIWENKLLGDVFDLRASVVLLALVFWGKIWGIVGMLLATPIMAVLKTLMEGWDVTKPLAKSMGQSGPPVEVCAAVVMRGGRVLVARRTRPAELRGLFEFPGGKLEPGESAAACLRREFLEELGYAIEVKEKLASASQDRADGTSLRLTAFAALPRSDGSEPTLKDGTHDEVRWVTLDELDGMVHNGELAPLDVPLVRSIQV